MNFNKYARASSFAWISLIFLSPVSVSAAPEVVHNGKHWTASVIKSKKAKICYLHGEPRKSAGKYSRRGKTYLQVTHRPAEKVRDEVSVTAGYGYRKDSEVTAEIDGQKRTMFTSGGAAWSYSAKDDRALVKSMLRGQELVIKGTSSRGTLTTDRYSLIGFTAAYRAAGKACGIK